MKADLRISIKDKHAEPWKSNWRIERVNGRNVVTLVAANPPLGQKKEVRFHFKIVSQGEWPWLDEYIRENLNDVWQELLRFNCSRI